LADKAVAAVREGRIRLYPDTWYNTFYAWMDNIRDWCISRQIWWGHRIPAWNCLECGKLIVASEEPTFCPRCGKPYLEQEHDVLDTWFSSALWPFSTLGWPENSKELQTFYPTSVLITSFDILFFWVARMMMMGLHFMDEVPFRDVYLHALVRDKHGKKMSKSTGNVIDPLDMIAQYGTDAFRFTLTAFAAQGREIRMDEERIDGYRRFINKLWNAARFAQMHLKESGPEIVAAANQPAALALPHRWILSRISSTTAVVRKALDGYNFNDIASAIYQFTWHEFCDWYVEWIKADLFSDDAARREQARGVLLCVLERILKLLHPICPFVTEEIWSQLPGERGTLMLEPFPEPNSAWDDAQAEQSMQLLMDVISAVRTIRSEADVHPSAKLHVTLICADAAKRELLHAFNGSICAMTRAESLDIAESGAVPDDAAHTLVSGVEVVVPLKELIDVEAELDKLARERKVLEQDMQRVRGKLGNENFLRNAPPDVVAKEQAKLEELNERLAKNEESRERLRKLR
ncbi:class I tRNA ligase family protein, partial [Candidatus Electronema sp. JM]|uniref:class I tRNA ligase family protein n=1 Tax=Candidatus Electronema sp. JM TaxID=3401571 RepID=UPI003AA91B1E